MEESQKWEYLRLRGRGRKKKRKEEIVFLLVFLSIIFRGWGDGGYIKHKLPKSILHFMLSVMQFHAYQQHSQSQWHWKMEKKSKKEKEKT